MCHGCVCVADVHGLDPGGSEPLPDPAHLHGRADPALPRQEGGRAVAAHLRHRRQRLHQHEALPPRPVHPHQVTHRPVSRRFAHSSASGICRVHVCTKIDQRLSVVSGSAL